MNGIDWSWLSVIQTSSEWQGVQIDAAAVTARAQIDHDG